MTISMNFYVPIGFYRKAANPRKPSFFLGFLCSSMFSTGNCHPCVGWNGIYIPPKRQLMVEPPMSRPKNSQKHSQTMFHYVTQTAAEISSKIRNTAFFWFFYVCLCRMSSNPGCPEGAISINVYRTNREREGVPKRQKPSNLQVFLFSSLLQTAPNRSPASPPTET